MDRESQIFVCGNALMDNSVGSDSTLADGKALFQNNCASCHNPLKDATGPALADINSFRSQEWMCRFLTKPKFIPTDKRATNLRKQYGLKCMKFPKLSCEEIKAVTRDLVYRY
jgi:cytochrome c